MTSNIFQEGSLVHLTVSVWGGRKKLSSTQMHVEADPEFIRGTKYLVEREVLKPVEQIRNGARGYLRIHSLPFQIKGITFVPKGMVDEIDAKLRTFQEDFNLKVDDFVAQYEAAKIIARIKLNGLFDEMDYPCDIGAPFHFSWQFFAMSSPGKMSILNPEIQRREEQRFVQMMTEFRENAVEVLRMRFSEMVTRIVDRLSGEEKRFKNTTVTNIQEFLNSFDQLNINNDEELKREVDRVRQILAGVDPNAIRSDDGFRIGISKEMAQVQDQMESMMERKPRRRFIVEMDEEEAKEAA